MDQIYALVTELSKRNIRFMIIGNGSNLVFNDNGYRGVIIRISRNFSSFTCKGEVITAQAGIRLSTIANIAVEQGLSGFEFASGIPGTLGGAVFMNAGAYGGEMKDIVVESRCIDIKGKEHILSNEAHEFGYRTSVMPKKGYVVLQSVIKLKKGEKSHILELMKDLNSRRKEKQPLELPSAGSVFKRPEGHYTGELIENCGLKGYQIGGAQISTKHCGFIVNVGNAKSDDIIRLIDYIKEKIYKKHGVNLETELKIIGEHG